MQVKTAFRPTEKVYLVDFDNKCLKQGYIDSVDIHITDCNNVGNYEVYIYYTIGNMRFPENRLFATADEACLSLKNQISWIQ